MIVRPAKGLDGVLNPTPDEALIISAKFAHVITGVQGEIVWPLQSEYIALSPVSFKNLPPIFNVPV